MTSRLSGNVILWHMKRFLETDLFFILFWLKKLQKKKEKGKSRDHRSWRKVRTLLQNLFGFVKPRWRRYNKAYQRVLRNWSFAAFCSRRRNSKRKTKKEKAEITWAGGRYAPWYWDFTMVAYQAVPRNWIFAAFCSRSGNSERKTKKEKAEITRAGERHAPWCRPLCFVRETL